MPAARAIAVVLAGEADASLLRDERLAELFEAQSELRPNHTAVECGGTRLSYAEVERQANQLAHLLRSRGVGPGSFVALLLPRSADVYVAILAILKAGAAYVPLDPEYPADRIAWILGDCRVHTLITHSRLADALPLVSCHRICLDQAGDDLAAQPTGRPRGARATSDDTCYVIYTSGSTGRPKGVEITHRSACHLVRAEGRLFGVGPEDRVYQGFSIAFDASVEEVWLAFFAGATLVAATAEMVRAGPALPALLAEARVSVLSCVPTLLSMMSDEVPGLRLLILGGEACPQDLVRRWHRPGRRIVNTYGPTEATVIATCADLHPERPVTIGHPLPNYRACILDPQTRRPVAPGEAGELHLGGVGLARGYVNRPELTADRFIPDPFCGEASTERLYRTGDLVRLGASGEIEFLGRIDTQVKLRGFRIELSEIESALLQCPAVRGAVVALREAAAGLAQLAAYVVAREPGTADEAAIKSQLRAVLPAYMIPATVDELAALPTLPSGKVDRSALPAPAAQRREANDEPHDPPTTPREVKLVAAWKKLFAAPVGRTDDFFLDLGGHSLLAATVVSQLRGEDEFHDLSVLDVYNYPTIAALAAEIDRRRARQGSGHGLPVAAPPKPSSLIHALCAIAQLPGLYLVLGLYSLQWLAPYLVYSWMTSDGHALRPSLLCSIGALVVLPPLMLGVAVVSKWTLIGRYVPGRYRVWGWFYLRWWLNERIASLAPTGFLAGTPLLPIYLRLLGARVGRNVHLATDDVGAADLVTIADHATIGEDAALNNATVEAGWLTIGSIEVGRRAFVGVRSVVGAGATLEDGGRLEDLSLLPAGACIPAGETWLGSPAKPLPRERSPRPQPLNEPGVAAVRRAAILHGLGVLVLPTTYLLALLPGMLALVELAGRFGWQRSLLAAPLVAVSFVVLLALEIAAFKWLLLGRVKPGRYPLHGGFYLRKWFVDQLMGLSLDVLGPLYATLYLAPWYRLLGAKLGRDAEVSTACSASPDMLQIGDESFIADYVSLGAARVENGTIEIAPTVIGRRAFVGNSAAIPAGTRLGDGTLVGVLSAPPRGGGEGGEVPADTSWLGSPAVFLPQRHVVDTFSEESTFKPTPKLYAQRYAIEFFRITLPVTVFVMLTSVLLHAVIHLRSRAGGGLTLPAIAALFPLLYVAAGLAAVAFVVAAKWVLMGRYRAGEKPLWSPFVWRTELVTALHENLADAFLVGMLCGTPWVCWFFRLVGARIGRRVFLDTTCLTEFDLIRVGDDACINAAATLQTHLFEDRVMKLSTIEVGARCTVGTASVVLYDTTMTDGATLGDLSLLMKGESLPGETRWEGSPARRVAVTAPLIITAAEAPRAARVAAAAAAAPRAGALSDADLQPLPT
jgi:non-ribosomal peptide synthetase-like protein